MRISHERAWSRVDSAPFLRLDLRAHTILARVPIHDIWLVELPGGGPDRTLADVRNLMRAGNLTAINPAVRALFQLRAWLGRVFQWDAPTRAVKTTSFIDRLSEEDRTLSLVEPGSPDGPFTVMYVHSFEAVSEVRNATVHCFSALALEPRAGGYHLFWAIYVAPVSRLTGLYMALIDPFRRAVVYPAVLRHIHRSWCATHAKEAPEIT